MGLSMEFNEHWSSLELALIGRLWEEWNQNDVVVCDIFQNFFILSLLVSFRLVHHFFIVVWLAVLKLSQKVRIAVQNFLSLDQIDLNLWSSYTSFLLFNVLVRAQ